MMAFFLAGHQQLQIAGIKLELHLLPVLHVTGEDDKKVMTYILAIWISIRVLQ